MNLYVLKLIPDVDGFPYWVFFMSECCILEGKPSISNTQMFCSFFFHYKSDPLACPLMVMKEQTLRSQQYIHQVLDEPDTSSAYRWQLVPLSGPLMSPQHWHIYSIYRQCGIFN